MVRTPVKFAVAVDLSAKTTPPRAERNVTLALYATAGAVAIMGLSYAAVPLYQMFCQRACVGFMLFAGN